jgi:enoyl-CoA hydratase
MTNASLGVTAAVIASTTWPSLAFGSRSGDGVVIAKEAFRLVEQSQAYQGEEVASYLFHAYGANLQFAPGEFNFVKTRAQHRTKEAFRLRDEHFYVPEPE